MMISEASQIQKDKYCMIWFLWSTRISKFMELESRSHQAQGKEKELVFDGYRVSVWDNKKKILQVDSSDGIITLCIYLMPAHKILKNSLTLILYTVYDSKFIMTKYNQKLMKLNL